MYVPRREGSTSHPSQQTSSSCAGTRTGRQRSTGSPRRTRCMGSGPRARCCPLEYFLSPSGPQGADLPRPRRVARRTHRQVTRKGPSTARSSRERTASKYRVCVSADPTAESEFEIQDCTVGPLRVPRQPGRVVAFLRGGFGAAKRNLLCQYPCDMGGKQTEVASRYGSHGAWQG